MDKSARKFILKDKAYRNMCAEMGHVIFQAFTKAFSHPYIKVDCCPDFDNLLIVTYGRFMYKFLNSKKGMKIWEELGKKYADKLK